MTSKVSVDEFPARSQDFLAGENRGSLVIERDGQILGALISPEEYETLRRIRSQRLLDAMDRLSAHLTSVATPEELEELARDLDRHNL